MEKKIGFKDYLLEIAVKETNKDLQTGLLLALMHLEAYETGEYITFSEICYQFEKKQKELCV